MWTKEVLVKSLKAAGVAPGKDLLVHSAMSSIGYVEGGPATVVAALLELVGTEAHLLMPSSPVVTLQAEHPQTAFSVAETPSKMGAITEYFRREVADARSAHPLEPVAVKRAKKHSGIPQVITPTVLPVGRKAHGPNTSLLEGSCCTSGPR